MNSLTIPSFVQATPIRRTSVAPPLPIKATEAPKARVPFLAESGTVLPVPAHVHKENFCEICREGLAREQCLQHAVSLGYLTNCAGDHTALVREGNTMAHAMAEMAWNALGQPSREDTTAICVGCYGWDGCDNASMGDWFREQDAADRKAQQIAARIEDIATDLMFGETAHDRMALAFAMVGNPSCGYSNDDILAGLEVALAR
jgi:hypothetical protein